MIIESIRIRNIASLIGTQKTIHLTKGALSQGLIAITGKTGSGKSTVIDAVCLALYGITPRLDATQGDREGKEVQNLLSRGAQDAFAEVDFQDSDGRSLRSRWSISRNRKGNIDAPKMILTERLQNLTIAELKSKVVEEITRCTGMSFKQFNGIVVLSQGSFSSFLKGEKQIRSELLERLTGTDIYGKLSQAAFENEKQKAIQLKHIELSMENIEVMSEEDLSRYLEQKKQKKQQEEDIILAENKQREKLQIILDHHREHQNLQDLKKQYQHIKNDIQSFETQGKQLHNAKTAEPLRLPLDRVQREQQIIHQLKTSQKNIDVELKSSITHKHEAWNDLNHHMKILEQQLALSTQWLDLHQKDDHPEPETYALLKERHKKLDVQQVKLNQANKELETLRISKKKKEKEKIEQDHIISKQTKDVEAQRNRLEDIKKEEKEFISKNGNMDRLSEQHLNLQQAYQIQKSIQQHFTYIETHEQEIKELLIQEKDFSQNLQNKATVLKEQQSTLQDLERAHSELLQVMSLNEHRQHLSLDKPCPLCFHPVSSIPDKPSDSLVKNSKDRLKNAQDKIAISQTEHQHIQKKLTQTQTTLQEKKKATEHQHSLYQEQTIHLHHILKSCGLDTGENESPQGRLENIKSTGMTIKAKKDQLQEFQKSMKATEEELHQSQQQLSQLEKNSQKLISLFERLEGQEQAQQNYLEQNHQDLITQKNMLEKSCEQLGDIHGIEAPPHHQLIPWLTSLERTWKKFQDKLQIKNELHNHVQVFKQELQTIPCSNEEAGENGSKTFPPVLSKDISAMALDQFENLSKQDLHHFVQNTRTSISCYKERINSQLKLLDRKTQLSIQEKQQHKILKSVEEELQIALKDSPYRDIESAKSQLLSKEEMLSLEKIEQKLQHEKNVVKTSLQDAENRVKNLVGKLSGQLQEGQSLETIRLDHEKSHLHDLNTQKNNISQEIGIITEKLKKNEENQDKVKSKKEKWQSLKDEHKLALQLHSLIGHSKGETFRSFAQSLTLEQLVYYANHRLSKFKPRYRLATRAELQLDVIDADLANERRPVSTLSGGESFLVSLALALGLSDFRRGTGSIKSVFIDEGFGSLDENSLEMALSTLEQVQSELDAQVIVISHVGELEHRWTQHVHVNSLGRGQSWLVIPGQPKRPPKDADLSGASYQPPIDQQKLHQLLHDAGQLSRSKIAQNLGVPNDQHLLKTLQNDPHLKATGKVWIVNPKPISETEIL
jgi:exonuclease SbcC